MCFYNERKINICDFYNKKYLIYAHTKEGKKEKLEEHTDLVQKYFLKIIKEKNLNLVFEKIEDIFLKNFSLEAKKLFRKMILNVVILHDIGKVNPCFQKNRLKNDLKIKEALKCQNSHHSLLSSIIYINTYFPIMKTLKEEELIVLLDFMMMNAYVISRHHGSLTSWKAFKETFDLDSEGEKLINDQRYLYEKTLNRKVNINIRTIKTIFEIIENKCTGKYSEGKIVYRYIYQRLMLSLLIACDFYATSEFMDEVEIKDIGIINDIDEFYNVFKEGKIYKSIREYESEGYLKNKDFSDLKDINVLRDELFLDAEKTLNNNIKSDIFYLEAPTGSGKSNVATNLSFKLLKEDKTKNKIFYVYPFNTLVEQNINTLEEVFEKQDDILEKIAVINSIEPIKMDKKSEKSDDANLHYYKKALLNRQFLNYPVVLTTHVTIFKYLFGTSKENIFALHQLSNSVIILDEIQSYKNLIWGEIITFLSCYAKLLNIKIIIMSATLPDLDKLSLSNADTVKLIDDRKKYFENPIFKNRVNVDYTFLDSQNILEDLHEDIKNKSFNEKKILIEFISKKSAYDFYSTLKNDDSITCEIELMSGDDSIGERDRIIKKVKKLKAIILVATQVIEAGVDIDMDIGYKNISMLDSEEQFLGRINRSCKKKNSKVYFFKFDESKNIYKEDIRQNQDLTLENQDIRLLLNKKRFNDFYDLVIKRLKKVTNSFNDLNIEKFFNEDVKNLEFEKVEERLELISDDKNKISVYLSSRIIVKGETLDGNTIWEDYKTLLMDENMDYSERRVKLSKVRSKMNNFIYEIKWSYDFPYNDRVGDLYFIEDGDSYFKNGKLDKEKFKTGIGDFI